MYSHDACFKDRVMRVSGIVYCFSQKDAEEVTVELQRRSLRAGCYHASLDHRQRSHVHQQWIDNSIHVRTPPPTHCFCCQIYTCLLRRLFERS